MLMIPLEGTGALDAIQTALTGLSADVTALIPVAIGVAVIPFAARRIWKWAKGLIS